MKKFITLLLLIPIIGHCQFTKQQLYSKIDGLTTYQVGYMKSLMDSLVKSTQLQLSSGANIKTLESQSLLGSGNIDLVKNDVGLGNVDNTSDANKPVSTATQAALDGKQQLLSLTSTSFPYASSSSNLGSTSVTWDNTKSQMVFGQSGNAYAQIHFNGLSGNPTTVANGDFWTVNTGYPRIQISGGTFDMAFSNTSTFQAGYVAVGGTGVTASHLVGSSTFTWDAANTVLNSPVISLTSTSSRAGIRIASVGLAPSSLSNGDIWNESGDLRFRAGGASFRMLFGNLTGGRVTFNSASTGLMTDDADFTFTGGNSVNGTNLTVSNLGTAGNLTIGVGGGIILDRTITSSGTTGDRTINKLSGCVNFAGAATSVVVTNSLVTANSIILTAIQTNDATMKSVVAVPTTGSFTIHANTAATSETKVCFIVTN